VDFQELADVIQYDQGLTTNILKLVNSAYFGFSHKINSLEHAIAMLGVKRIYYLTIGSAVSPVLDKEVQGYDLSEGDLWQHSVGVALGAEKIAENSDIEAPDYTFTAGLLIDIGKIALSTFLDLDPQPVLNLAYKKNIPFNIAEEKILGISHPEAGAILLDNWNLPDELIQVVRYHHQPNELEGDKTVVDLVHIADILMMEAGIGDGQDGLNYRSCQESSERIHFDQIDEEKILVDIFTEINQLSGRFVNEE